MPAIAPPPLEYGQAPHPLRRKRIKWAIRLLAAAAFLVTTFGLLFPLVDHRLEFLNAQDRWRTFSRVPGQWSCFEKWTTTADSASRSAGSSQESAHYLLRQTYNLSKAASQATLFLHARRAPGGPQRLIIVEFSRPPTPPAVGATGVTLTLDWYSGTPGSWLTDPANLTSGSVTFPRPTLPASGDTTFFAGQPDPDNPADFTLPYQIDGTTGVIDAHLLPDGKIDLKAISGPLSPQ